MVSFLLNMCLSDGEKNCMFYAFVFRRYTVVEKRFLVDNDDVRIHVFCCEYCILLAGTSFDLSITDYITNIFICSFTS